MSTAFCEYCGAKVPVERVEATTINAENVTVNNYYYPDRPDQAPSRHASAQAGGARVNLNVGFAPVASPKSRGIALLLCFFLGFFGAHRFYTGRYAIGVAYLLTFGVLGLGWLVDFVLILLGRMRDRDGLAVSRW